MKKNIILLLIAAGLIITGCKKSFLEEEATNQIVADSYFKNYAQAYTAVSGVYRQLQNVYNFELVAGRGFGGTDEVAVPTFGGLRRNLHIYDIQPNNGDILRFWRALYTLVYRANQCIDRISVMESGSISESQKNTLVGEAKFLRAMAYFMLVTTWGDVPLTIKEIKSEADIVTTRSPVADVYAQIIDDLKFAQANCISTLRSGLANKGAATALLGKVYLQMTGWPLNDASKFQLAAAELKAVIDNPVYNLCPVYADIFSETKEDNATVLSENIFVVKFDGPGKGMGGQMGSYMGPTGNFATDGAAFNTTNTNPQRHRYYDSTRDIRFFQNVAFRNAGTGAIVANQNNWKPMKWVKPQRYLFGAVPNYGYDSPLDFALLRYADVLLLYAECLNEINGGPTQEALDQLNRIRVRARRPNSAGLTPLTISMNMNKAGFVDTLLKDRFMELCFEGYRKIDLIRTGKIFTYLRDYVPGPYTPTNPGRYMQDVPGLDQPSTGGGPWNIKDHQRIWPIPAAERSVSNMTQNDGY